nr:hypothetical protein CFP56_72521 [Quercus suber]
MKLVAQKSRLRILGAMALMMDAIAPATVCQTRQLYSYDREWSCSVLVYELWSWKRQGISQSGLTRQPGITICVRTYAQPQPFHAESMIDHDRFATHNTWRQTHDPTLFIVLLMHFICLSRQLFLCLKSRRDPFLDGCVHHISKPSVTRVQIRSYALFTQYGHRTCALFGRPQALHLFNAVTSFNALPAICRCRFFIWEVFFLGTARKSPSQRSANRPGMGESAAGKMLVRICCMNGIRRTTGAMICGNNACLATGRKADRKLAEGTCIAAMITDVGLQHDQRTWRGGDERRWSFVFLQTGVHESERRDTDAKIVVHWCK